MKITLSGAYGRLSDREPFLIADNTDLTLEFESVFKTTDALIHVHNERAVKKYKHNIKEPFTVPVEFLHAGTLKIEVDLLKSGEVVKKFSVEPIKIKDLRMGFEGHAEVDALRQEIAEAYKAIGAAETQITELAERTASLTQQVTTEVSKSIERANEAQIKADAAVEAVQALININKQGE
ncbi:MAG: hypothetical protein LBT55_01775 [Clostridiaceae bacterium]|jgi:hypothetical protein|nr:hypothetical protein [Clostridiaceae bacterium]